MRSLQIKLAIMLLGAPLLVQICQPVAANTALATAQQELHAHLEAERYQDALDAAKRALRLAEQQFGTNHLELVRPLIELATVQEMMGDFNGAEANCLRGIALLETKEGFFSQRLIPPWTRLGTVYQAAGREEDAIEAFQHAKHITHRTQGLFNLQQIPLIEHLTQSYINLARFEDADREQRYAFRANEHRYGKDNPRLVPAIYRFAAWHRRTDQFGKERDLYKRALGILEQANGIGDLSLVKPLRAVASTYRLSGFLKPEGEQALQRALRITEGKQRSNSLDAIEVLIDLGDWYLVDKDTDRAFEHYRQAWALLASQDDCAEKVKQFFDQPVQLRYRPPLPSQRDRLRLERFYTERYVDIEFTVKEDGAVADLNVIDADLPFDLRNAVMRELRFARYRPRLIDGHAVATRGVRYRQSYSAASYLARAFSDNAPITRRLDEYHPLSPPSVP